MTIDDAQVLRSGMLDRGPAEALAGVLGVAAPDGELPAMWHTVYLLDRWSRAELGADGHPLRGLPTPPSEPHRRMFAGGRARHLRPLRFGEPLTKTSRVLSSTVKQGRSGVLTFVTVRHQYAQGGLPAVIDEHDIVYRPLPAPGEGGPFRSAARLPGSSATAEPSPVEAMTKDRSFEVNPVTLFLFSTVTANAHRIHYDLPFARSEGHPDLVVHGPLQILLMAGALRDEGVDLREGTFDYRLLSPAWGSQTLRVGRPDDGDADVVVIDGSGRRTARASVTL